jgi:hypothetical protein
MIIKIEGDCIDRRVIAVFMALLIINLTPASAFDMAGIQNNVNKIDNYAHADGWYKFWHFFDFTNAMASLVSQVIDTANELPSDLQKGVVLLPRVINDRNELDARNEKLNALANYYSNDTLKSDWVNDTDDIENNVTNNNTSKTDTNANKRAHPTTNIIVNSSNSSGNQSNNKLSNNEVAHESNISNKTKNTLKQNASTPSKEAVENAAYIQKQLKEEGIDVKVVHHNLNHLQKDDLVQLVDIQGYIKYMVYEGNTTQDGNPAVLLYNGQNDQIVTYNKFIKAYTGQVLELSNNNDTNITTVDLAEKIYSTHLNVLTHKIGVFGDWITVGTALEWIGGAVIGLTALIGAISAIILACGEKVSALAVAIISAIIITIIIAIGLVILTTGIILVSVLQKNSDDTKAEKDDLTNQCV